jgi:competence ComEA-like helix-hairpin-helix protein
MPILVRTVVFFALILPGTAAPKPLQKFENCTFIPTNWADGDSFRIRMSTGEEHTIRLYGVDCIELHVEGNDRTLTRLREQRRYFGIADVGKNNEESMKIALALAKEAADFTAKKLKEPFTIHTRFSDGGGDPNFKRIYGFITLADGKDLGSVLVNEGLARSQGKMSSLPDGTSIDEARGILQDHELQALKNGKGIWAKTNWDKLPTERQLLRKEAAEAKIVKDQDAPGHEFKIDPNVATAEQLDDLDGIGPVLAKRIIEERQKAKFLKAEDLLRVKELHKSTLEKIRAHLVFPKP